MSITTDPTTQTGNEPGNNEGGQTGSIPATQSQAGHESPTFSQAQVNAFIGARLKEARTKWDDEQRIAREQAERAAADAEAKELGEWKTVAETHEARVKELESQLTRKERDLLATRIAAKHQLPETLASRLIGDDADALEADAVALATLIEKPAAPAVVPPSSGSPANGARPNNGAPIKADDLKHMTWQQIATLKDEGKLKHLLEGQPR